MRPLWRLVSAAGGTDIFRVSKHASRQSRNSVEFYSRDTHLEYIYGLSARSRMDCEWVESKTMLKNIEKESAELFLFAITFFIHINTNERLYIVITLV